MGYVVVIGRCFACKQPFSFNPHKVPSYQGEPICLACIEIVNAKRREMGNPEWPVPADAYEPIDESDFQRLTPWGRLRLSPVVRC